MWRILNQAVAFLYSFSHQAEFAVFKIPDTSVHHVGGGCAGTGAEIALINNQNIYTLKSQVAKSANTVDTSTDNQHRDRGIVT